MKKSVISFLFLLFIIGCREEKIQPQITKGTIEGEIPSHESWKSKITFSDNGKIKAILFTDHLKKYEEQKVTLLDGVKIDFYDTDQNKASVMTSLSGKVDDATMNMYAIDNVVAENDSGTVLKTSELMWRNSDQKIITDKFVSIKSTKEVIEGYGMESDQSLRNYVIFNVTYSAAVNTKEDK